MKLKKTNIFLVAALIGLPGLSMAQSTLQVSKPQQSNSIIAKNSKYQQAYNKALAAYLEKNYEKTIEEGLGALPEDPNGDLHAMIGDSFYQIANKQSAEQAERSMIKARALMEKVLKTNPKHKMANNILGNIYTAGKGVEVDNEKAYQYFKTNAEQGFALDTFNAGQAAHSLGKLDEALAWYEKALELAKKDGTQENHLFVETTYKNMAFIFYGEDKKFYERRVKYLPEYAKYPYRTGRYLMEVALDYLNGNGVPKSKDTFFKILKTVADDDATVTTNFPYRLAARAALVEAYLSKDFKDDMKAFNYAYITDRPDVIGVIAHLEAFKRFQQASAKISEGDIKQAISLFEKEAKVGNEMAKTALALLDLSGYKEGVSKENMKKSAEVLKKALYQGNYIGMDTLVMAYLTGDIVEKDTNLAKSLIEIRKADNSIEPNEDTVNRVHFLEAMVEYFTDNKAKAFESLKALADKGYVEAIENLGLLYAQEGNSVEAEKYLKKLDELKKASK